MYLYLSANLGQSALLKATFVSLHTYRSRMCVHQDASVFSGYNVVLLHRATAQVCHAQVEYVCQRHNAIAPLIQKWSGKSIMIVIWYIHTYTLVRGFNK